VSLRTRIAAVAGLAVAVAVVAATVSVYLAVRSNLRGEVERALEDRARPLLAEGPGPPPGVGPPDGPGEGMGERGDGGRFGRDGPPPRDVRRLGGGPGGFGPPPRGERFGGAAGYVQRVLPSGAVQRPPGSSARLPVTDGARDLARTGDGRSTDDVTVDGVHLLVLSAGIGDGGAVQVARPLTETDNVLDRVLVLLIVVGVIGIALAALLGAVVARTALGPIARFTRRTEAIAGDADISERMEVVGRDELARLAQSFNTTLDSLERAVEAQRQLVADASHELRTPIASLRANVQTLEHADRLPRADLDALRADIIEELDELTALVADVVELARGARSPEALDDVRLDHLVGSLVERARRRGDGAVGFETRLEPTLVRGEPDRIARAVTNLLDNARKWSPPGTTVDVDLSEGTLTVRDHGPGFAEEDLPRVFERFYRSRAARGTSGSGLGLAIVRQAADSHGGSAAAANAPDGGAVLRVRFGEPLRLEDEPGGGNGAGSPEGSGAATPG
jgi:two-component system, OmpR family, sensor histidine kinase MprB